jgi:hypothetical protein
MVQIYGITKVVLIISFFLADPRPQNEITDLTELLSGQV